jgi:hypothetical protein
MLERLRSRLGQPKPAGPQQQLRSFGPADQPISEDGLTSDAGGWRAEVGQTRTIRLFEISDPGVEQCMLTYRAQLRGANVQERAYLEMWCRLPGGGEFFSKGFHDTVTGTTDWAGYEIPFRLRKGQRPDLLKLNITVEGGGTVWIKDVELLQTPLR